MGRREGSTARVDPREVAAIAEPPRVLLAKSFTHLGLRRRRLRMKGAPAGAVLWVAHLGGPPSGEAWTRSGSSPSASPARRAARRRTSARRGAARPRRPADASREDYDAAVDAGDLVVAHIVRGAIHALAPDDLALYGRALLARDDDELGAQLGRQVQKLAAEKGFAPTDALDEVAAATTDALNGGRALDKTALHEELRGGVNADLMPWCKGCESHHVAPMLWRYATVKAGVRLDAERRYVPGRPGRAPAAGEAVRRFLRFYAPARPADFAEWAGLRGRTPSGSGTRPRATSPRPTTRVSSCATTRRRSRAAAGRGRAPPAARRPVPAEDQPPLLAPDDALRKRLFRPVASPGRWRDGRLAGLWRVKAKGQEE